MAYVKTVKPAGGGDYTSLLAWEDYADGQPTADQWAECYSGGDLGGVHLDAGGTWATPTSEVYPKIYVAEGNGHGGDISSGAYMSSTGPIVVGIEFTRIEGLRINCTSSSAKAITFETSATSKDCRVDSCFIHGTFQYGIMIGQTPSSTGAVSSVNYIQNNIIIIDGSASTTPTGLYVQGSDGSLGTTNAYVYNNSIYVKNPENLNNYGLRFTNVSSSTLNITVQNNIIIGGSNALYHSSYSQISFNTGSKIFTRNISGDDALSGFGGVNNQINVTAAQVWTDAPNNDFTLSETSYALDNGGVIPSLTVDAKGTTRPQGSSYDLGALETPVITITTRTFLQDLNISDTIIGSHEFVADALIDGPTGQICELVYPVTKNASCPNCIYSPRERKSSNIYKDGGPIPFPDHTICPWCGGAGRSSRAKTEEVRLRVYWSQKDWIISGPVESPNTKVMIIGYMKDLPKIEKCDKILLNKAVETYRQWMCERDGEATPWGLSQDRYFSQMLRRVGGG
jgi:hypothetical protein